MLYATTMMAQPSSPRSQSAQSVSSTKLKNSENTNTTVDAIVTNPSPVSSDPLEKFNRTMFSFNDKIDYYILKPIATFYTKVIPKPIKQGIHNVFSNLNNLPTIANDILQLHLYQTLSDAWRFAINTTIGIGGIFDVAETMGLAPYSNDFGLTMARYGWKNSTYIVFPFLGSSTLRDSIGWPVDYYEFSIYPHVCPISTRYGLYGVSVVNKRAELLEFQPVFEEAALDKYSFIRNAYLQRRQYQMEQNDKPRPAESARGSNPNDNFADTTAVPSASLLASEQEVSNTKSVSRSRSDLEKKTLVTNNQKVADHNKINIQQH